MRNLILALVFFFFYQPAAYALSELELGGEIDFSFTMHQLPTGKQGESEFNISSFFLNLNAPLVSDNLFVAVIEGSEQTYGSDSSRFELRVRQAYLDLVSPFEGMHALRAGLIPQPWQEAQYELWSFRFLGQEAWALTEKWNYQNFSDLGLSFMSELPWSLGERALTLTNGEGRNNSEEGPYKDASLFFRMSQGGPWSLSVSYTHGRYDTYERDIATKERWQALLTFEDESWFAGLEYLGTQDPANALEAYDMAESVNVVDFRGTVARGMGASAFVSINLTKKNEMMLRYDYLDPLQGEEDRDLHTFELAWVYQVVDGIRVGALVGYTHFGELHSSVNDRSKVSVASQVLF